MTHKQEDIGQSYPYDGLAESDHYNEVLDELWASGEDGKPHVPSFAKGVLERLRGVGLLHRIDTEPPVNVRKAKMGNGQEVWLRFDTRRDEYQGYMAVEILDAPRSDGAILAAMIAWFTPRIDVERFREARQFVLSGGYAAEKKRAEEPVGMEIGRRFPVMREDKDKAWEAFKSSWRSLQKIETTIKALKPMYFVLPLLRYYKPDFDSRSPEEKQELMERTFDYVNDFLDSLRRLQNFLEYGVPNQKKLTPSVREPGRDVQAAVLHDVDGLSYREIGERMRIAPPDLAIKGENQTVRKMVDRGSRVLVAAFGEVGWRKQVEKMKAEKDWWQSLSEEEQEKIIEEEAYAS
jgi:hypothetical protein